MSDRRHAIYTNATDLFTIIRLDREPISSPDLPDIEIVIEGVRVFGRESKM